MMKLDQILELTTPLGLVMRGGFQVKEEDKVPTLSSGEPANTLILFGNAGSSFWPVFSVSPENQDGCVDPLNRWSQRIGDELAAKLDCQAFYPFGGPPYTPFISWAKKAEDLHSSKLGMLIHPQYGLWHAYRFALAFSQKIQLPKDVDQTTDVCSQCPDQPCLSSCPVDAFDGKKYEVEICANHILSNTKPVCPSEGCQARMACPEGESYRYEKAHLEFHMNAFLLSMKERFKS